jgi:asparagine synthase (glutamine-hydrolysing)
MFAFAIWDNYERTCFLARDPLGIKPLYLWRHHGEFAFASEVRSLLQAELTSKELCPHALEQYLLYGSVQEPQTLIRGISALSAGHWLRWKDSSCETKPFWKLNFAPDPEAKTHPVQRTRAALADSVRRHLVSDVPVGLFLSGGMDSTAIAALATSSGVRNLETFCISFDEQEFNEGDDAARTAAHFGTVHHDCRMTSERGKELLADFLAHIDQPSNDGFNTFCVAKVAHDHGLKVVMSGLGGDELFGGYQSFVRIPRMMTWHRRLAAVGPFRTLAGRLGERYAGSYKLRRVGAFLASRGQIDDAYWTMRAFFTPVEAKKLVRYYMDNEPTNGFDSAIDRKCYGQATIQDQIGYLEMTRYMRNQLLRDSDVMSMAWGLELRVPLVDQKVIEAVGSVPAEARCARGKDLLRHAVPEIPPWVANGPKRGFRFPFEQWVRQQWSSAFRDIEQSSPVPLQSWYRVWCLFTLNHFLQTNQIDARLCATGLN